MRIVILCVCASIILTSCTTLPSPAFERIDGRKIEVGSPLERQFEADRLICQGDLDREKMQAPTRVALDPLTGALHLREKLNEENGIARGCMAAHGYIVVPSTHKDRVVYGFMGESGPNNTGNVVMRVDATPHN